MAYDYPDASTYELSAWDSVVGQDSRLGDDWIIQEAHHTMYDEGIAGDHRAMVIDMLHDYIEREYGYEWDEFYDWEDFRAWYDS